MLLILVLPLGRGEETIEAGVKKRTNMRTVGECKRGIPPLSRLQALHCKADFCRPACSRASTSSLYWRCARPRRHPQLAPPTRPARLSLPYTCVAVCPKLGNLGPPPIPAFISTFMAIISQFSVLRSFSASNQKMQTCPAICTPYNWEPCPCIGHWH